MKELIAMKNLIKANEWKCPDCKTGTEIMVLGCYNGMLGSRGLYCKCEAERLCKTPYVKQQQAFIKKIVDFPKKAKKAGKQMMFMGIPIIATEDFEDEK